MRSEQKASPSQRGHDVDNEQWLDRMLEKHLDAALKSYVSHEPRPGLEQRLLAHSEAHGRRKLTAGAWVWGFAGIATMLLCGFIFLAGQQGATPHVQAAPQLARSAESPRFEVLPRHPRRLRQAAAGRRYRDPGQNHAPAVARAKPFSIAPLSEQERLLLKLVALPQNPLAHNRYSQPITIEPLQISALTIQPLTSTSSNSPSN